jgi:hypothetical protein
MAFALNWPPPLPREHGAWAMFVAPLLVGIGAAGIVNFELALFVLTAFGFFLLRYPLMLAIKSRSNTARVTAWQWSAVYGALTVVAGTALLLTSQLWSLIPIGLAGFISLVVYLWYAAHRAEMTTMGEWVGIAGLVLASPGAYLVATHRLDATAWALYFLNVLYFGGTVFYVKFRVREQPRLAKAPTDWRLRLWAGRITLLYHFLAIGTVVLFALLGLVPALVPLAFILPMCKTIGAVLSLPARLNMRRLGFVELGLTTLFALVVLLAYR